MSSSNSPCAACKFLRRKCTQGCVFAPYFPPDQPSKFANVHRVFGASNVAKLLNELNPPLREDAVNSLAYEAEARLRDPVYGCVGHISQLQTKLKQVQFDLNNAKKELSTYIGPAAFGNFLHQGVYPQAALVAPLHHLQVAQPVAGMAPFGVPGMGMNQIQQQMVVEAQQQAAIVVAREQEMLRSYEQQQHQQEFLRLSNRGFEGFNQAGGGPAGSVGIAAGPPVQQSPQTGLGLVPGQGYENLFHVPQQYQEQPPPPQQQQPQHRTLSDEGRSGIGPSS